ncbi:MAG: MerR family transcriptional regulator [Lutibacter sp.]|jgi:DNA-binding transcriptional MerR regulator|nr:MerR family transcriptional regulator [Lutibacter sp.]
MHIVLPEKRYYKVGEVARAFGLNASHIRFWEKEFDLLQPKKNKKGDRLFTAEDIAHLKVIYHLVKERGYTLEGAKLKLKENPQKIQHNQQIITRLEAVKQALITIKEQLS